MMDILREADKIIHGQRAKDYGNAEDSFKQIADYVTWPSVARAALNALEEK